MDTEEMNDALDGQDKRVKFELDRFEQEKGQVISFFGSFYDMVSKSSVERGRLFGSLAMLLLREESHSFTFSKEERAKVAQLLNANSISFKEEMGEDDSKILTLVFGGE